MSNREKLTDLCIPGSQYLLQNKQDTSHWLSTCVIWSGNSVGWNTLCPIQRVISGPPQIGLTRRDALCVVMQFLTIIAADRSTTHQLRDYPCFNSCCFRSTVFKQYINMSKFTLLLVTMLPHFFTRSCI